ncbi:Uu.00g025130.m01.CDS01 [Anthostomella pinea]|uniref:Uu.00g025130.m01.CDS01 n=1 Tax=Anthostomella pinea TaxID=933095 RepID=A0AAI8V8A1_9PEZI|nr:Uu.00g025130.m01.CDS01 [Anthostomella pinea]
MSEPSASKAPATAPKADTASTPTPTGGVAEAASPAPASPPAPETATTATTATTAAPGDGDNAPSSSILPASHWAQAPAPQVDDGQSDVDSAYGDDNASSTASLSASILEYRTVHGRTFHSERGNAQSWNPNDAQHDESMDLLHHVSTLLQGGNIFLAPIDDGVQKVLDLGCGTELTMASDFADQYPGAEVIGVDISPQQPQWVPSNCKFEIDDITMPWTYAPNNFDYIHMRWLVGAIPDWDTLFKEAFKSIKPGGYFESVEASPMITSDDNTVPHGCALDQWGRVFWEAGKTFGRSFKVLEEGLQRKAMEAAGFVDIKEHNFKTPLGSWPADPKMKEIGQFNALALEQDIEGFIVYMWTTVVGWSKEEISVYAAHLRRELRSTEFHAYYPQKVLIGRKPAAGEA